MTEVEKKFEGIISKTFENASISLAYRNEILSAMKEAYNLRGSEDIKAIKKEPRYGKYWDDLELDESGKLQYISDTIDAINNNNI